MRTLRKGSRNADVMFLQLLINKNLGARTLMEDGVFGQETYNELVRYQHSANISPANGIVNESTWRSLKVFTERRHRVQLIGQPSTNSCWATAASMLSGNDLFYGREGIDLNQDGTIQTNPTNVNNYINNLGWHMVTRHPNPSAHALIRHLKHRPLWVTVLGANSYEHAFVISGVLSDLTHSNDGTVFIIHDPFPINRGRIYASTYRNRILSVKTSTGPGRLQMGITHAAAP